MVLLGVACARSLMARQAAGAPSGLGQEGQLDPDGEE
jgi:hypothetical protein